MLKSFSFWKSPAARAAEAAARTEAEEMKARLLILALKNGRAPRRVA